MEASSENKMNDFKQRALTGVMFVICLVGCILLNAYSFWLLFGVITIVGTWEFYSLAEKDDAQPQVIYGTTVAGTLFGLCALVATGTFSPLIFVTLLPLLFLFFIIEMYTKAPRPFINIGYTLLGIFYVALPFSLLNFLVFNEGSGYSSHLVLGYFFILWSSDTGAYLVGRTFGKHPLFPRISPKKSWEGSIGGTVIALITAFILSKYFNELSTLDWLVLSIIISVIGGLGDLVESLFKRSINIKDSGNILPGHGGLLDRFDGLLISVPFIVAYLMVVKHLI